MNRKQTEDRLREIMKEAVILLKEYEPNSDYLAMSYHNGRFVAYNDAFRSDVKKIDIIDYNLTIEDEKKEDETDFEKFFEAYDENAIRIFNCFGPNYIVPVSILKAEIKKTLREKS